MTEKNCLELLQRKENDEVTARMVAEEKNVSQRTAMKNLKKLDRLGYLERHYADRMHEPSYFTLTEKGEKKDPEDFKRIVV